MAVKKPKTVGSEAQKEQQTKAKEWGTRVHLLGEEGGSGKGRLMVQGEQRSDGSQRILRRQNTGPAEVRGLGQTIFPSSGLVGKEEKTDRQQVISCGTRRKALVGTQTYRASLFATDENAPPSLSLVPGVRARDGCRGGGQAKTAPLSSGTCLQQLSDFHQQYLPDKEQIRRG